MFASVSEYIAWLAAAPEGTRLVAKTVCEQLIALNQQSASAPVGPVDEERAVRERFWLAPAEMRMSTRELAAAVGKPRSWVWRHTSVRSELPMIPHRKEFGGELVFVVGEVRSWLQSQEIVVVPAVEAQRPRLRRSA